MSDLESHIETMRVMSRYENDLINHRIGWLSAFQGFLFAALAFIWDKSEVFVLTVIICAIGIMVSISIGLATLKANKAINNIQMNFDKIKPENYLGPDIEGSRSGSDKLDWLLPGSFIPWFFAIGWVCILLTKVNMCT